MTYTPDLKELAVNEYNALIMQDEEPEQGFEVWYEKVFLPAIYQELGKELKIL